MKNIVVYFPNWGTYSAGHQNLTVSMIPWDKITVVNHAFFTVDTSFKMVTTDSFADFEKQFEHSGDWAQTPKGHMGEYKYFKEKYPDKKIMISVGGWTRGENFHAMALTENTRATFINSAIEFLKTYLFIDGIDIDWEYPGVNRAKDPNDEYDRGCPGGPEGKQNFTALLREMREAFNKNGLSDKMITIAAPAGYDKLQLQEPNLYHQYLNFINVMTYDFHGAFENLTNHHSPLYANPDDPSPTSPVDIKHKYNTDAAMKELTDVYGVPKNKLNVGTPFYSRGWKNVDGATGKNGLFAKASGAPVGNLDNPQSPGGQNSYPAIKQLEKSAGWTKYRDASAKVPYLYNVSQGIMYTYEDEQSLSERCDFVNSNGYGGMIVWQLSTDDANGFPLTSVVFNKLKSDSPNNLPHAISVSVDNAANTGSYTITATISAANTATSMQLYENNVSIKTEQLTPSSSVVAKNYAFTKKTPGTYTYRCDAANNYGTTPGASITVTVKAANGSPDPAKLNVDQATNNGNYTVTVTIPAATTATSLKVYENKAVIKTESISTSASVQTKTYTFSNKAAGTYEYMCELINTTGTTASATITVSVQQQTTKEWAGNTAYTTGDIVSYQGKPYKCRQSHTSLTGWEPPNVPALWEEIQQ